MIETMDFAELDGFQFPSRARALDEWRERKWHAAFRALCHRLRVAKRYREIVEERGERYEKMREQKRKSARSHRASETARVKAWRLEKRKLEAPVIRCRGPGCVSEWSPVPTRGSAPFMRYCSHTCRKAARAKRERERRRHTRFSHKM
jgi:hypothetical protein